MTRTGRRGRGLFVVVSGVYWGLGVDEGLPHVRVKRQITVRIRCVRVGFNFVFMFIVIDI
jgi:hypothetical protein